MAHDHGEKKEETPGPSRTWKEARSQPRVRPQWNPVELANQLLDEMEEKKRNRKR